MKKIVKMLPILSVLVCMLFVSALYFGSEVTVSYNGGRKRGSQKYSSQVESLDRGLVAVKSGEGIFLSWRLLGTEVYNTSFNVYRDGKKIAGPISNKTNYWDASGNTSSKYYVTSVINNSEVTQSDSVTPLSNNFLDVPINKPSNTKNKAGESVTYSANDATVADVDGDGAYEIILKWDPSDSKDNSQSGYTSNVYIDCYEMNGERKWRIDLGKNIRAGAHYTQFIAYDLNGDGKAEVAMKTADGTVDGTGTVIGNSSKDYRNSNGYVLSGPEYLTLFEGKTGKALSTIDFTPERGSVSDWGDSYGNRVDRFLAGVAYFDGKTPSLVMCRGYYTRSVITSYEYKGGTLNKEWTFDSKSNSSYSSQGSHSLSIADVDDDGFDEVIYGSCVIDNNGKGLYSTGQGHGDALHVGDFDPNHAGLEIFQVHENKSSNIESVQMRDAKTGKTLWSKKCSADVGRGLIANIGADYYPYVALSSKGAFDSKGNSITSKVTSLGINFANYWDGDLYREILDKTYINKWNSSTKNVDRVLTGSNVHSNNGTKSTPSLSADIFGDWREEVMWPTSDDSALRIYTTDYASDVKLYTLMHDTQYRTAIAWQNVAYNQPPHPSYYIGPDMDTPTQPNVYTCGNYKLSSVNNNNDDGGNNNNNNDNNDENKDDNTTIADSWSFSDSSFSGLGTINSTKTVDGLSLVATSSKTMSVKTGSAESLNGNAYSSYIATGGGGNTSYRAIKVPVGESGNVEVVLKSSGTSSRTLIVANSSGKQIGTITAGSTISIGKVNYSNVGGYIYLYSSGSNINVYAVNDLSSGSSDEGGTTEKGIENGKIYYIKNAYNGKYLNVENGSSENGANINQASQDKSSAQRFKLVDGGNGYYGILTACSNYTIGLDVWAWGTEDGTNIATYEYWGGDTQLFKIVDNNDGTFAILTKVTSNASCLDVYDWSTADGGNICQWNYWGGECQKWIFDEVISGDDKTPDEQEKTPDEQEKTPDEQEKTPDEQEETVVNSHNFSVDGTSSNWLTFSSKKSTSTSKGSTTYDGMKLNTCLKVESSTNLQFTTTSANQTLVIVASSKSSSGALKISGPSSSKISLSSSIEVIEIKLSEAGTYTISKSAAENYIFYIAVK